MKFNAFGFCDELLEGLDAMGFEAPTPIQEKAIPDIVEGRDIIACAQTGTGKTAAYILPLLDKIFQNKLEGTSVLVIVPTRELAQQVDQEIEGFSYFLDISSIPVYGGGDGGTWDDQKNAIQEGVNIIVGTPGRLSTHMNMDYMDLSSIQYLVLDEADRMLDMGFQEEIMRMINMIPEKKQTLLFSATMPDEIRKFSKNLLQDPAEVNISMSKPAEGVLQVAYLSYDTQKTQLLEHLLSGKQEELKSVLIFASRKKRVADIAKELDKLGYNIKAISSDLEQEEREEVLRQFRNKRVQIMVATDLMSRGIDIKSIDLIINYDVPQDPEDYVHRVGRTARAEETGLAITFINPDDQKKFHRIETMIESEVRKLPLPEALGEPPQYRPFPKGKRKKERR